MIYWIGSALLPKYDLKIPLRDANTKIEREELFRPTIGKFSKHKCTNENGQLLIDFAKEKDMVVKDTWRYRMEPILTK